MAGLPGPFGPLHNFHWTLPEDCKMLQVIVLGQGHNLSLCFTSEDENDKFLMPLHEGIQSVCTGGVKYRVSAWFTIGYNVHSYCWMEHRYPEGHLVLRFVYRKQGDDCLPPLSSYTWAVLRANMLTQHVPPALEDPLGVHRHLIFYTEGRLFLPRKPTCNPRTCAYNAMLRQGRRFVMI